jgi:hypothetical protein
MTSNWRIGLSILNLTENQLRIGIMREEATSGEGPWWIVWNFASKEYADSYEAPAQEIFPTLPEEWRDYVEPKTNLVTTYILSDDTPFDWCNFDGSLKGIGNISPLAGIEDITLVLHSGTGDYTLTDIDGTEYTGKYTLNSDGIYTFSDALPEIVLSSDGRAVFKTNADRTLRIMSYETSDYTGAVTDLWLGSKEIDDQGNLYQYMGYHFAVHVEGGVKLYKGELAVFDPDFVFLYSDAVFVSSEGSYTFTVNGSSDNVYGIYLDVNKLLKDYPNCDMTVTDIKVDGEAIEFDDEAITRTTGDGETATIARRYIVNPWGTTAGDASNYNFSSSLAVTVYIEFDVGEPVLLP